MAAVSVSLFQGNVLTGQQLFLLVAGSRLGSGGIVVLIGALDYLEKPRSSFGEATGLGTLTFLLTYAVYLPATVGGVLVLPRLQPVLERTTRRFTIATESPSPVVSLCEGIVAAIGVWPGLIVAVALLFGSLTLFDRVLEQVETAWLRNRLFRYFERRWVAFVLGVLLTGLTTSVAFSLGVAVPLYNRGYVTRREILPYVLGANMGTLFDTLLVVVLLESPAAVAIVLALILLTGLVTVVLLIAFRPFHRAIGVVQSRLVDDRRTLLGFLLSLLVVPIALVLLPV
ncbi:MAG: sodium:phosphate symporter [Halobacteriales archaeon]